MPENISPFKTRDYYIYDSSTSLFPVSFTYLKKTYVKVRVYSQVNDEYTSYSLDAGDYEWSNDSTINLLTLPSVGDQVEIYRETEDSVRLIQFDNSRTLHTNELNKDSQQHFDISQEAKDLARESLTGSDQSVTDSAIALENSETALTNSETALTNSAAAQTAAEDAAAAAQASADTAAAALLTATDSAHAHTNKDQLDKIGEDAEGNLTYDGNTLSKDDHNHDDDYYTETEIDTQMADKQDTSSALTVLEVTALPDVASASSNIIYARNANGDWLDDDDGFYKLIGSAFVEMGGV